MRNPERKSRNAAVVLVAVLGLGFSSLSGGLWGQGAPRDDGSIWTPTNHWSLEWEEKYSDWVAQTIDADFFLRLRFATDCADVPYLVRWIFARNNSLPQGAHDRHGNVFGHWSKDFREISRHEDWKKDNRFMEALVRVNNMTQCRGIGFDTYPTAVLPEAGFLRPGTVITDENHSRIVTAVDRHSFHPIVTSASTLPPAVRRLTVQVLNRDAEFDVLAGYGILNWSWWRRAEEAGEWETVPDEEMPGYSMEQYDLANTISEEHLAFFLQKEYALKVDDPKQAIAEMFEDLREAVAMRIDVADEAWQYYQSHRSSRGDTETDAYEFFSTNQRDERIRTKFDNMNQLVKRRFFTEDQLNDALASQTFLLSSGEELTYLELAYAAQGRLLSPEPWDPPLKRWGAGPFRLLWRRRVDFDVDAGLIPGPKGGILVASANAQLAALTPEGREMWSFVSAGTDTAPPARGASGNYYLCDSTGEVTALAPDGKVLWKAQARGYEFPSPAVGGADGLVYTVSNRGVAQAFNIADGSPAWRLELGGDLKGVAKGGDGPAVVIDSKGRVVGVSSEGKILWERRVGPVYAQPVADEAGNVYALSVGGVAHCFAPEGTLRWSCDIGGRLIFRPTLGPDGALYVGAGQTAYCISPSGRLRWSRSVGEPLYSSPAGGPGGRAYVGSEGNTLFAISPEGEIRWRFTAPSSIMAPPLVTADGRIVFGVMNKQAFALRERE
jgi:outer membrane protein assembly factor BamB